MMPRYYKLTKMEDEKEVFTVCPGNLLAQYLKDFNPVFTTQITRARYLKLLRKDVEDENS